MTENFNREDMRMVYEQNWLHFRHAENERLWFTNIFALVVVGALAFVAKVGLIKDTWPLFLFLMIASLSGLFIALKIWLEVRNISERIRELSKEMGIVQFVSLSKPIGSNKGGTLRTVWRLVGRSISVGFGFILFYGLTFSMSLGLLIFVFFYAAA